MGQVTQETGKRHNGAAAAILAVPFPRVDTYARIKGGCLLWFPAAGTSYVIVRASFAPIRHSKQPFSFYWRPKSLALAREAYSGIGLLAQTRSVNHRFYRDSASDLAIRWAVFGRL